MTILTGLAQEVSEGLNSHATPYNALKSAEQSVQLSHNPSNGLSRRRYTFYSNETLFDETNLSEVESGIRLETGANGTDSARIRSSIAGQYVAHGLSEPGLGMIIDDVNVEKDENNHVSLTHGSVYAGAFWWDPDGFTPYTGVGYEWNEDGWYFFLKSLGDHIGDSPVHQSEFSYDPFDGTGPSGFVADPSNGLIVNWPYTWYNQGPFDAGVLNPDRNRVEIGHEEAVTGRPTTNIPNFPVKLGIDNQGTAQSLGAELGGMQYTTYGGSTGSIEFRETDETRITEGQSYIDTAKVLTDDAVDPDAEPGRPLISAQRDNNSRDMAFQVQELSVRAISDDIYVFLWDEWNPDTALTNANFSAATGQESQLLTDTSATDYTPSSQSILRSMKFFEGGAQNKTGATAGSKTDARVASGATRVITAVYDGDSVADVDPFIVKFEESF